MRLLVRPSSLSKYHSLINEDNVREKLIPYKPPYEFRFTIDGSSEEKGIESVSFFEVGGEVPIKISRGEERIFIWCFFLALFEVDGWADVQSSHFFIDDPVTSLDDHNLFITAFTILDLIEKHFENRKIIIATHHVGLFSILFNNLLKGEKKSRFEPKTKPLILSGKRGDLSLEGYNKDVFLYHLRLIQILKQAEDEGSVKAYHFVLLRQVLENVASFLGTGRVSHVLEEIGIKDAGSDSQIINTLSHKNIYFYETDELVPDNKALFTEVLQKLMDKYHFVLHTE
jgi:wobble nucleotide-excising tRNase